ITNQDNQAAADINRTIDEYKSLMNEVFARYELLEKRIPTSNEVRELFNDMSGRKSIFENEIIMVEKAFDEYISTIGEQNNWSESTYKKNRTIKKHFLESNSVNISFPEINEESIQRFINHLTKKNLRNTTIAKDYSFVRWFLGWAYNKGYYTGNVHKTFKPRLKGVDGNSKEIIYLSLSELEKIRKCNIPAIKKYLVHTRDVFLFCCYTSLRYSDVATLRHADVKDGFIQIVTQKTTDGLKIELNKYAQGIIDKYKDKYFKNGLILPVVSNQKMNEYLKELGQLAELNDLTRIVYYQGSKRFDEYYPKWQLLTTHCARRTFVVTALQLGIPVEVIIRWTGHSDYDAMKPYVAIVDELKKKEMDKFNSL
ncbi:MAG: phage integrase SAM-like domain-containing protein, partial [Odoribacter sp.]